MGRLHCTHQHTVGAGLPVCQLPMFRRFCIKAFVSCLAVALGIQGDLVGVLVEYLLDIEIKYRSGETWSLKGR